MELIKQNEIFALEDTNENGWKSEGQVNYDLNGHMNLRVHVSTALGSTVGDFNYSISPNEDSDITLSAKESIREEFYNYANSIINYVMNSLN